MHKVLTYAQSVSRTLFCRRLRFLHSGFWSFGSWSVCRFRDCVLVLFYTEISSFSSTSCWRYLALMFIFDSPHPRKKLASVAVWVYIFIFYSIPLTCVSSVCPMLLFYLRLCIINLNQIWLYLQHYYSCSELLWLPGVFVIPC